MAEADYLYGNLDVIRDNALGGFLPGWNWTLRGELQLSSRNLLGSEVFSAGGSYSVRGYEESEVVGDNAVLFSQELLLPVFQPARILFGRAHRDALRPFVFHDYARVWNVDKLAGEQPFNVHSIGLGIRYQFSQYGTLNLAYGWQLTQSGSSDTGDSSRGHIALQISY